MASIVLGSDGLTYGRIRAILWYEVITTNTTVTYHVAVGARGYGAYSTSAALNLTLSGTGQTSHSVSGQGGNFTSGKDIYYVPSSSYYTYSWARTTSKQTKTISFSLTSTGSTISGTSTGSLSVTIPALPTYTVKYNANGGSGAPSSQTKTYGKTLTLSSTKPTRTGYTFSHWDTKSDGSGTNYSPGGSYTANAAVTLYARWSIKSYTLTYNANGGTVSPTSKSINYNATYGTLPTPTRAGYLFNDWYTASSGGTLVSPNDKMGTSNVTIYAHWQSATLTLTANANGGSIPSTSGWTRSGNTATKTVTYNTNYGSLPGNPTRRGYTFAGWYTASSGGTQVTTNTKMGASNTTIYAHWNVRSFTITAHTNDGEGGQANIPSTSGWNIASNYKSATKTVNYGTVYGVLPTPTWTNHRFLGWFTDSVGGTLVSSSQIMSDSAIDIYAHWSGIYVAPTLFIEKSNRGGGTAGNYIESDSGEIPHFIISWNNGNDTGAVVAPTQCKVTITNQQNELEVYHKTHVFTNEELNLCRAELWPVEDDDSTQENPRIISVATGYAYDVEIELILPTGYDNIIASDYISQAYFIIDINSDGTAIGFGTFVTDLDEGYFFSDYGKITKAGQTTNRITINTNVDINININTSDYVNANTDIFEEVFISSLYPFEDDGQIQNITVAAYDNQSDEPIWQASPSNLDTIALTGQYTTYPIADTDLTTLEIEVDTVEKAGNPNQGGDGILLTTQQSFQFIDQEAEDITEPVYKDVNMGWLNIKMANHFTKNFKFNLLLASDIQDIDNNYFIMTDDEEPISGKQYYKITGTDISNYSFIPTTPTTMEDDLYYEKVDISYYKVTITYKLEGTLYMMTESPEFLFGTQPSNVQQAGAYSFQTGQNVYASGSHQAVFGRYNKVENDRALIIGNGSNTNDTIVNSNAFTIGWDGNVYLYFDTNNSLDKTIKTAIDKMGWTKIY